MGLNGISHPPSRMPSGAARQAAGDLAPLAKRVALTERAALAERIAVLERGPAAAPAAKLPLGVAAIDTVLGGGLPTACVHEIAAPAGPAATDGAAAGFAAWLVGRFAARGPVLWIAARPQLYAPGLAALGLDPARLVVVAAPSRRLRLWALAEALRLPGLGAALAELDGVDFVASRRLQLAAAASGVSALLLDESGGPSDAPSAARTRWRVGAAPSVATAADGVGPPRWRLALRRGPAAARGDWIVEESDGALRLAEPTPAGAVAAAPADRSAPARVA